MTPAMSIARIVRFSRYGGGLHREHLAEILRLDANTPAFKTALMIAYRQRQIDFCGLYVVATTTSKETA